MKQDSTRSFKVITVWLRVGMVVFLAVQWHLREKNKRGFGWTVKPSRITALPGLNHSEVQLLLGMGVSG